jgi:hypothetical protein
MKYRLEDFIREHRAEFDDKEPSEKIWTQIDKGTFGKKKTFLTAVSIWRAAAIIFFGLSTYLFFANQYTEKKQVSKLQTEFKDLESFYGDQIAEKVEFIDKLDTGYEDDQFTQDVQKLDAMYEVLREEMKSSPSEKVKDALILNMLIRIDLLNQQIQKLEDHRKGEKGEKESAAI